MDLKNIKKVATSLSKLIDDNEKIALPLLSVKLSKASESYPEDITIGKMRDVISRMASSKKIFITRAEIKDLYNKLYTRNSKFAEIFSNELGKKEEAPSVKHFDHEGEDNTNSLLERAYDKVVDPTLASALNSAFGNNTQAFSKEAAENAKLVCSSANLKATVDVAGGDAGLILCKMSFETPKGKTSVFVPVEMSGNKAMLPSVFIGNSGPADFSKTNLVNYIKANAGEKLNITEKVALAAVNSAKNGDTTISSVDLALTKLNAQKESKADFYAGSVIMQKVAAEEKNLVVSTPTYKDSEIDSFASAFDSPVGIANFKFGKINVNNGKEVISRNLDNFGVNNYQVSVFACDDKAITYAVSLNAGKVAFKVPVKIENNKIVFPSILISNGSVEKFSKDGIDRLFNREASDYAVAAAASPLYGLKASELVEIVRNSMAEQNLDKAEDALNILSQSGDDKAYQTAFSVYTNGLSAEKTAAPQSKCCMIVRNASSKHPLCGHTGLPLHKVYQDKNGDCRPSYRRGMDDTQEGAYFLNSKIFF